MRLNYWSTSVWTSHRRGTRLWETSSKRHTKKTQVNAILNLDSDDENKALAEVEAVELDPDQYIEVTALHAAKGRPMPSYYKRKPFNRKKNGFLNKNSDCKKDDKVVIECWHCGKKGHSIADCKAKRAGKPKAPGAGRKVSEVYQAQAH